MHELFVTCKKKESKHAELTSVVRTDQILHLQSIVGHIFFSVTVTDRALFATYLKSAPVSQSWICLESDTCLFDYFKKVSSPHLVYVYDSKLLFITTKISFLNYKFILLFSLLFLINFCPPTRALMPPSVSLNSLDFSISSIAIILTLTHQSSITLQTTFILPRQKYTPIKSCPNFFNPTKMSYICL